MSRDVKKMAPKDALAFAIEKLENEVDREFDGADVSLGEQRDYLRCIDTLRKLMGDWNDTP